MVLVLNHCRLPCHNNSLYSLLTRCIICKSPAGDFSSHQLAKDDIQRQQADLQAKILSLLGSNAVVPSPSAQNSTPIPKGPLSGGSGGPSGYSGSYGSYGPPRGGGEGVTSARGYGGYGGYGY